MVDVQHDFAHPRGSLYVREGERVVEVANAEINAAGRLGAPVFYSQDWHPEHTPHFARDGGIWPIHCVRGTWGAELDAALLVNGVVVRKGSHGEDGYSAFSMRDPESGETRATQLDDLLRAAAVGHLVVLGLATDHCVRATVLDALERGYDTRVVRRGIRAVELSAGDGDRALDEMRTGGAVIV